MNYLITFKKSGSTALFKYDPNGSLKYYKFSGVVVEYEKMKFMFDRFPFKVLDIEKWKAIKDILVTEVHDDISFTFFWNKYNHKFGNKQRAIRLYESLPDIEKIKAIEYLRKYDQYLLMHKDVAKANPETYLNQQRWNN